MGQGEVIKFLESCDGPVTRKQIADSLQEDAIKISHILRKLLEWNEIKFIECSGEEIQEKAGYFSGRRTRLYFVEKK